MNETILDSFCDKATKKGKNNIQIANVININIHYTTKIFFFK